MNFSKTTWKFRPNQYFQVVLEIFPSSFGNVSCIENAFGTVYGVDSVSLANDTNKSISNFHELIP
jgi:hypothetical protein